MVGAPMIWRYALFAYADHIEVRVVQHRIDRRENGHARVNGDKGGVAVFEQIDNLRVVLAVGSFECGRIAFTR